MKARRFGRKSKILAWFIPALILLVLAGGLLKPWLLKQVTIDSCLDSGGAFDYEAQTCIHEIENNQY